VVVHTVGGDDTAVCILLELVGDVPGLALTFRTVRHVGNTIGSHDEMLCIDLSKYWRDLAQGNMVVEERLTRLRSCRFKLLSVVEKRRRYRRGGHNLYM
jgi:hypothetical protein